MKKVTLEIQHFHGCPNGPTMINNVKQAVQGLEDKVEYRELLVDSIETAQNIGFLGSPTLMINGEDFEGRPRPEQASLNCRIYKNGVPTSEVILEKITKLV